MGERRCMAREINRGEIWFYQFKAPDKLRPVIVVSRQIVIGLLHTVMVAPITSTIHGAPSEVLAGIDEGLKTDSAVNCDHIQTVEKIKLKRFVGRLSKEKMQSVCKALKIAMGC